MLTMPVIAGRATLSVKYELQFLCDGPYGTLVYTIDEVINSLAGAMKVGSTFWSHLICKCSVISKRNFVICA